MIATSTSTSRRVPAHTADHINDRIQRETEMNIAYFAAHPEEIDTRLRELDEEWDIERALETMASSLSIFGFAMGIVGRRYWLLLPVAVQGFFLQHAMQGWCPPLPLLRRLGFRTQTEIESERYALKAIKGDFRDMAEAEHLNAKERAERAVRAVSHPNGRGSAGRMTRPSPREPGRGKSDQPRPEPGAGFDAI